MDRPSSLVPLIPRRSANDFIHRIADLKAEASSRGYGTLSYFPDIAMREAMIQADQEAHDRKAKYVAPTDLWLPER
jgi:hypothetical protein